jgi:hypothetical protein
MLCPQQQPQQQLFFTPEWFSWHHQPSLTTLWLVQLSSPYDLITILKEDTVSSSSSIVVHICSTQQQMASLVKLFCHHDTVYKILNVGKWNFFAEYRMFYIL